MIRIVWADNEPVASGNDHLAMPRPLKWPGHYYYAVFNAPCVGRLDDEIAGAWRNRIARGGQCVDMTRVAR